MISDRLIQQRDETLKRQVAMTKMLMSLSYYDRPPASWPTAIIFYWGMFLSSYFTAAL